KAINQSKDRAAHDSQCSLLRRPGVIVARNARPLALVEETTVWPICQRAAGQVGLMRQLPVAWLVVLLGRRDVGAVVHPAMPAGRDFAGFGVAVVDDPAPVRLL